MLMIMVIVRLTKGRYLALHRRKELWKLRHSRYAKFGPFFGMFGLADSQTETKHFIYFYLGHCAILLFKTQ